MPFWPSRLTGRLKKTVASQPLSAVPQLDIATPGAVNPLSNVVDPRKSFPVHYDFLMRDLFTNGHTPEQWQVIAADEARLDETGMVVEFTLLKTGTDLVWRRCVDVCQGRLVAVRDVDA